MLAGAAGTAISKSAFSQTQGGSQSKAWRPGEAAALCIGISTYAALPPLKSAAADAELVAAQFLNIGFDTHILKEPTHEDLLLGLAKFQTVLAQAKIAAIYVAGHGGYLGHSVGVFAIDAMAPDPAYALPEAVFVSAMSDRPRHKVLLLDCCRTALAKHDSGFPQQGSIAGVGGLFTLYAAQPGAPAYEGTGRYGPFAKGFTKALAEPAAEIEAIARRTRLDVIRQTGGRQIAWSRSSLLSEIILNRG